MARQGKQYQARQLSQGARLHRSEVGIPMCYDWGTGAGYYFLVGAPSDFGLGKPMGGEGLFKPSTGGDKVPTGASSDTIGTVTQSSGDSNLSLVLFYAPWLSLIHI